MAFSKEEWKKSGKLVAVSVVGGFFTSIHLYSIGVFITPIRQDMGWSLSEITFGLTAVSIIGFVLSPFVGLLVDRFGPRIIGISGISIYLSSLALLSVTGQAIWTWWAASVVLAFGAICTKPTVWIKGIAAAFDKSRGLAIAVVVCGAGFGSAAWPVIANELIARVGWRGAYQTLAVAGAVIAIPVLLIFFKPAVPRWQSEASEGAILNRKKLLLSRRFVQLCLPGFLVPFAMVACMVHFAPIMISHGMTSGAAAWIAGLAGLSSVAGRLISGYLLDIFPASKVGAVAFAVPVLGCIILSSPLAADPLLAAGAAVLIGFTLGAEMDILVYLTSRYFGIANFGFFFGTIVSFMILGQGTGPLALSLFVDATGSYSWSLLTLIPLLAISSFSVGTLGPYPKDLIAKGQSA